MKNNDSEPFYEWLVQEEPELCNVYMRGHYLLVQGLEAEKAARLADELNHVLDDIVKSEDCGKIETDKMDTFLNTEAIVPDTFTKVEQINFEGLAKVHNDWHQSFIDSFKGVPVRIDETLEGGQYYIAISRELHEDLKVEIPSTVPLQAPESPVEA